MKSLRIAITGDLSITGSFEKKVINNEEIFSDEILNVFQRVDYCIANLEGPVTKKLNTNKEIEICSPTNSISYLAQRNIKVFNLANNHIFDYGMKGYNDTVNELKNNNCLHFGAWLKNEKTNDSIVIGDKIKVRLIAFTEKIKSEDKSLKLSNLKNLSKADINNEHINIIFHHGGEEYTLYPSPTKRNLLKKIRNKFDPDFIISHHSHTLQGHEKIKKTKLFYSLGNFIFDIPPHHLYNYTNESAILILTIKEHTTGFELIPIKINRSDGRIELADYQIIDRHNRTSDFSNYKTKWRKEAYRVLLKRNPLPNVDNHIKPLYKKNNFELFFSLTFYKKALKMIFDNNNRSLYWNAIIHKLFHKND